jgi:glycosyltransferase involved in cell wall biosynthesis
MIVFNARFLTQELRGVQRFAEQICLALKTMRNDLVFVTPTGISMHESARRLDAQCIGRHGGHLWEQLDLPLYLLRNGNPLLVSLGCTAPLLYGNQVATHHDITYVRHPESYSRKFCIAYRLMTPILFKRIKSLITVSQFSRQEISHFYDYPSDRILVVPNAVGEAFQPLPPDRGQQKYLLAVSSPTAHKNFSRLISAFLRMKGHDDVQLRIVGATNGIFADDNLEQLARQEPRIQFLGRIDDAQLIAQYQGAVAFVFPSLYEGFGIPPLEAQACGCPVLAANAASIPEVLQSSALYFDPLDLGQMTQAMTLVLDNQRVREQLRILGLHNVSRFAWEDSARLISNHLDALQAHKASANSREPLSAAGKEQP